MKKFNTRVLLIFLMVLTVNSVTYAQDEYHESPSGWRPVVGVYIGSSNWCGFKLFDRGEAGFITETIQPCTNPNNVTIYHNEGASLYVSLRSDSRRYSIQALNPLNDHELIFSMETLTANGEWVVTESRIFRRNN